MQTHLSLLCFLFFLLGLALTASNDTTLDDWPVKSIETNLTIPSLGLPRPPAEFHIASTINGPKLRITSCLMVAIAALKTLALGDWDAKIIDGMEYTLNGYPEVSILVSTPRRKRNIKASFVNWAITVGLYRMIISKKFELAAFELRWSDELVGWVHIVNNPTRLGLTSGSQINETAAVAKRAALFLPQGNMIGETEPVAVNITNLVVLENDAEDDRLVTTFVPQGDTLLGIYDVFVPIMGALCEMAPNPSSYRSNGLIEGLEGFAGAICILPHLPLRVNPPYLEFRWMIRALSRIPAYMLEQRRFGDIKMDLTVDGVPIGHGALNHLPENCPKQE